MSESSTAAKPSRLARILPIAPRSLDRFAHSVQDGQLIVDTSKITLGPLPVALGQPGLIPAKSPTGCI